MRLVTISLAVIVAILVVDRSSIQARNDQLMQAHELRAEILKDQLDDYSNQISSLKKSKTYEDGVRDGIANAHNGDYVRGYHAALKDNNEFSSILLSKE